MQTINDYLTGSKPVLNKQDAYMSDRLLKLAGDGLEIDQLVSVLSWRTGTVTGAGWHVNNYVQVSLHKGIVITAIAAAHAKEWVETTSSKYPGVIDPVGQYKCWLTGSMPKGTSATPGRVAYFFGARFSKVTKAETEAFEVVYNNAVDDYLASEELLMKDLRRLINSSGYPAAKAFERLDIRVGPDLDTTKWFLDNIHAVPKLSLKTIDELIDGVLGLCKSGTLDPSIPSKGSRLGIDFVEKHIDHIWCGRSAVEATATIMYSLLLIDEMRKLSEIIIGECGRSAKKREAAIKSFMSMVSPSIDASMEIITDSLIEALSKYGMLSSSKISMSGFAAAVLIKLTRI